VEVEDACYTRRDRLGVFKASAENLHVDALQRLACEMTIVRGRPRGSATVVRSVRASSIAFGGR
jgi:hypothetical protein